MTGINTGLKIGLNGAERQTVVGLNSNNRPLSIGFEDQKFEQVPLNGKEYNINMFGMAVHPGTGIITLDAGLSMSNDNSPKYKVDIKYQAIQGKTGPDRFADAITKSEDKPEQELKVVITDRDTIRENAAILMAANMKNGKYNGVKIAYINGRRRFDANYVEQDCVDQVREDQTNNMRFMIHDLCFSETSIVPSIVAKYLGQIIEKSKTENSGISPEQLAAVEKLLNALDKGLVSDGEIVTMFGGKFYQK
jgi:hypothetical protein